MSGRAVSDRFLYGVILALAAPFASMGVTLGCFFRNVLFRPEVFEVQNASLGGPHIRLPGTSLSDFAVSLVLAGLAVLWVLALVRFVRSEPRSPLIISMSILAGFAFVASAWQNWLLAYPVCNAF